MQLLLHMQACQTCLVTCDGSAGVVLPCTLLHAMCAHLHCGTTTCTLHTRGHRCTHAYPPPPKHTHTHTCIMSSTSRITSRQLGRWCGSCTV
jgi:hypothetical protein